MPRSAEPPHPDRPSGSLYLVGHAHIDPVWLWRWQEGLAEVRQSWRSALDRMREYPEMRFTASSAAFYAWVQEHDPGMLDEIAERVAEGRWELAGGWWVEPDVNIPSGESFVRQALLGQRWFHARFGRTATVGFNPDGFGHAAGMPQILARSGLRRYVFMRPQVHEMDLPRIFRWTADDGSSVLAFRILWEYGTWTPELDRWVRRCAAELGVDADALLVFYGVGNHGGGPTRANLDSLRTLADDQTLPILVHGTMADWYAVLRSRLVADDLPSIAGDLQRHAPGCYSAHSGVKRWNRAAESMLAVAERWATIGGVLGAADATDAIHRAWELVAFNQFHDILAGSSIAPAYDDVRDELGEAMAIAGRVLNRGVAALARRVAIPEEPGTHLVVANPVAWPSRPMVELETGTGPAGGGAEGAGFVLEDDAGAAVPVQVVRSEATVRGGRARIAFTAALPALGYRRYRLSTGTSEPPSDGCTADDHHLANALVRIDIDATTGAIGLRDLRSGRDVLGVDGYRALVMADGYDTWGHGLDGFDQEVGAFQPEQIRLVEHGPVVSVLRHSARFGASILVQDILLRPDDPRVEIRAALVWNEHWRALKLRTHVAVTDATATFEAAYATVQRATDGKEVPGGRWVDVSGASVVDGARAGLAVITDSKHGYDVRGSTLGVTAVRSPVFAHHEPYLPVAGQDHRFQDQGPQSFRVVLLAHAGDWRAAGVTRAAAELMELPVALPEGSHPGDLAGAGSFASVEPDHVELRVLKRWEDGSDLVVRLFETAGVAAEASLALPLLGRRDRVPIAAHELLTVVVPLDPREPVRRVSALEWPEEGPL